MGSFGTGVDANVVAALIGYRPVHPLLPNLQSLSIAQPDKFTMDSIPHIQPFLGPCIKRITIDAWAIVPTSIREGLLVAVGRLCPNLRCLEILGSVLDPYPSVFRNHELQDAVCRSRHLKYVEFPEVFDSPRAIESLGSLPLLKQCSKMKLPMDSAEFNAALEGRFVSLETLSLSSTWGRAAQSLTLLQRPFTALDILTEPGASLLQGNFAQFTRVLTIHPCLSSLAALTLSEGRSDTVGNGPPGSMAELLRPLFALRRLASVDLTFGLLTQLDNSWIVDAAEAWPQLESLRMKPASDNATPNITLAGLFPLLQHCPNLFEIGLAIVAEPFDPALLTPGVRNLWVNYPVFESKSPITEPGAVFRCLVHMFPNIEDVDVHTGVDEEGSGAWEKFLREIRDTDWTRFEYYGRKIRNLKLSGSPSIPVAVHENVVAALTAYRPMHLLLPNLQALATWGSDRFVVNSIPYISFFLGVGMRELDLGPHPTPSSTRSILLSVGRLCSNLRRLHFRYTDLTQLETFDPPSLKEMQDVVCHLHHLEYLEVPGLFNSLRATECLGALPSLKECTHGTIKLPTLSTSGFHAAFEGRFKSLQKISFTSPSWWGAAKFLTLLQRPFAYLEIVTEPHELRQRDLTPFTRALTNHPCVSSLTTLILSDRHVDTTAGPPPPMADLLRPLFAFRKITFLHLTFGHLTELDDPWIADAAVAWPQLEQLRLTPAFQNATPNITLAGLLPLLQYCPKLFEIGFPIDAEPFDPALLTPGVRNLLISELDFEPMSPITAPGAVFRCLVQMFPNLKYVCTEDNSGEWRWSEAWDKVRWLLEESTL
ncbi:hypothetical protein DXG01_001537 [Tephrocybe rancida]|nr:hypothetical protein DXG01_001537 [Tephrocybe rancida]